MRHGALGLTLVGGAHIEDVGLDRLVQHHGPGGRTNERHPMLLQHGVDGLGVRCAPAHEQGQHATLLDQGAGIGLGLLDVEGIVQGNDLDFFAAHAALGVDMVQVELRALHGFLDRGRHRSGDAHGLPDAQLREGGAGSQGQRTRQHQGFDVWRGHGYIIPSMRGNHRLRPGQ